MPSRKLTALAIPTLAPGEWYDAVLPGLILRVGVKRRTWQFRYRANGTYHRKPLGHFPAVELAEAQDAARKLIERVDRGLAPAEPAPHPRSADVLTVGRLLDQFEAMRIGKRADQSLPKTMRLLRHNLKPYFALPAVEFSKADLRDIRNRLVEADTPGAANKLLGSIGPVLRWAAEEDLIAANFASAVRRPPGIPRSRVLTKSEIAAVWHACDRLGHYGRLIRIFVLSAQRLDEAASLKFGDILDGTWEDCEQVGPAAFAAVATAWRSISSAKATPAIWCFPPTAAARSPRSHDGNAGSIEPPASAIGCSRFKKNRGDRCRISEFATRHFGGFKSQPARRDRCLSSRQARTAEGRGVATWANAIARTPAPPRERRGVKRR